MTTRYVITLLAHRRTAWARCAGAMWIGTAVTSLETALVAHAIGAPVFFKLVSLIYQEIQPFHGVADRADLRRLCVAG